MKLGPLISGRKNPLSYSQETLVRKSFLDKSKELPLVISAAVPELVLLDWVKHNRASVDADLVKYGAILFRGFHIASLQQFRDVVSASSSQVLDYRERSSPRSEVMDRIYTSTDYPADQMIFLHNENSYQHVWPLKLFFFCAEPATEGGGTLIASTRRILGRIDNSVVEKFREKKILYVRNFTEGLGLSWSTVFQTTDKREVERYCASAGISFVWKKDGRLRTEQVREPMTRHPVTEELVWFNHATFFHHSTLEPNIQCGLREVIDEQEFPNNTYYGDGSRIESEVMDSLRECYSREMVAVGWLKGDVLVVDNMLVAHGRERFIGPRAIFVGMADPVISSE